MTPHARAAVWMAGAIVSFSAVAIAARVVLAELTPLQLMFYRNIIATSVLVCCLPLIGVHRLRVRQPITQLIRHSVHFAAQYAWFVAIALIPLAQVFALEFTVPIWSLLFASVLLGEKITPPRIAAVGFGFLGVLVIVRPGLTTVEFGTVVMLLGAFAFGIAHTLTRKITLTDSPMSVLVLMNVLQLPMAAAAFAFNTALPSAQQWPFLTIVALAALAAHYCLTKALSLAPANIVIPMDFLRLPLIALLAWWIFQEAVSVWVYAGTALMLLGVWINLNSSEQRGRKVAEKVSL